MLTGTDCNKDSNRRCGVTSSRSAVAETVFGQGSPGNAGPGRRSDPCDKREGRLYRSAQVTCTVTSSIWEPASMGTASAMAMRPIGAGRGPLTVSEMVRT